MGRLIRLPAEVMRKVEAVLARWQSPAASFDELDQALDELREAFEAYRDAHPSGGYTRESPIDMVPPVNTPVVVDMRRSPAAVLYDCGHHHADMAEAQRCWQSRQRR